MPDINVHARYTTVTPGGCGARVAVARSGQARAGRDCRARAPPGRIRRTEALSGCGLLVAVRLLLRRTAAFGRRGVQPDRSGTCDPEVSSRAGDVPQWVVDPDHSPTACAAPDRRERGGPSGRSQRKAEARSGG